MTNLLIRLFIKNPDKTEDPSVRTSYGVLGSCVGILCNLALAAVKFSVGMVSHSAAVTADAFNNFSDMASSLISLLGARVTAKPADRKHPFGYGRAEYITALIVSFAIINVGFGFLKDAVDKIRNPEEMSFGAVSALLLVLSAAVKLWMAHFNRVLSVRIHSDVLRATAADSLFDALTTSVTVISMLLYVFAGINIDGIASVIVALIVIWAGIRIARDTFTPLIGQEMDPETEKEITDLLREDPKILGVHDLVIHSYGPSRNMASVHLEVSSKMTLEDAHSAADRAEKRVMKKLGIILVTHVDPVNTEDERVVRVRGQLERVMDILDPDLSFHDLQVSFEEKQTVISFDLTVPYRYTAKDEDRAIYQVSALMSELDPKNVCEITLDRGVMEEKRQA